MTKAAQSVTCSTLFESEAWAIGAQLVAGVDEVGRGALAGPVVAAAVILDPANIPSGLDDSKKLSKGVRERLDELIRYSALAFSVVAVDASEIDQINILQATKKAMLGAVNSLSPACDYLLIDALHLPEIGVPQKGIIKGDSLSVSIAAASIVAKVMRDRLMADFDPEFPEYGFASNVGYGTAAHLRALANCGPTPIHRLTFRKVLPEKAEPLFQL